MPFVVENDTTISFAEFSDMLDRDQRLFEANEGLSDDIIDNHLVRATERILDRIRSTQWWQEYYIARNTTVTINTRADIPAVDPDRILNRQNDFTDLCVYTALTEFTLPLIADFGREDSSERNKMGYYQQKADGLFAELITAGDWYDFDDDSTIQSDERQPGAFNLKRIR